MTSASGVVVAAWGALQVLYAFAFGSVFYQVYANDSSLSDTGLHWNQNSFSPGGGGSTNDRPSLFTGFPLKWQNQNSGLLQNHTNQKNPSTHLAKLQAPEQLVVYENKSK